jgi:NitT/TauT family transport system permease protein
MLLLELLVRQNIIQAFILPAPSEVLSSLITDSKELFEAGLLTAINAAFGLLLSFVLGSAIAIVLSLSRWLRDAIYPFAVFFQTVPVIALAPVLVIWFGFGSPTVIASAFIVSVFPVIASVLLGIESTDPMLVDLFRIYQATRFQILFKLRLRAALPQIFSGLRIASGLAVIGAVVGEFVAGSGLGSVVDSARTQQRIDKVFAAIVISSFIGLIFVTFINFLSRRTLKDWHASERP